MSKKYFIFSGKRWKGRWGIGAKKADKEREVCQQCTYLISVCLETDTHN